MPKQVYPGGPGTLPIGSMASIFKCQHFWNLADGIIYQMGIQLCTLSKAIIWFWKGAVSCFPDESILERYREKLTKSTIHCEFLYWELTNFLLPLLELHAVIATKPFYAFEKWEGFDLDSKTSYCCTSKIPVKKLRIQQLNFCWQISARSFFRANSWKRKQISRAIGQFVFSRVGGWLATWLRFLV